MHPYPHVYVVAAAGDTVGPVSVSAVKLPDLQTAPPPEFDGPGGMWSPETLLCASVADCFILTFRAVCRAARLEWQRLDCRVEGVLDRVDRVPQFTRFSTFATLTVPVNTDVAKARELLERAEHGCLIANSLRGSRALEAQVVVADR
jgi:organic hydroperoxide reductase OsmC/OhrA